MTRVSNKPKRRNAKKTKAKILSSAQESFAERGYAQAGIREIAAAADVSAPMLLRYFGSKAGLFEQALIDSAQIETLFQFDKEAFGFHLAKLLMSKNFEQKTPAMVALSTGDDDAKNIATQVTAEHVLAPLAKWLGPPNGRIRSLQIMMMGMGFVLFTRQLSLLGNISNADNKILSQWFAKAIQDIVDAKETTD